MIQNKPSYSARCTKDSLKSQLEQCETPVKTMLQFCILSGLVITIVGFYIFFQKNVQVVIFLCFPLWIAICRTYWKSFYSNLGENLSYFHKESSAYFDNFAKAYDEVIYDFLLFYDSNGNDIFIHFEYDGQNQKISICRKFLPQPYGGQQLVVVARRQSLPEEFIIDYQTRFDLRNLYEKHYALIKRREKTDTYHSKEYQKMQELPMEKNTFHLALISKMPK